MRILVPVACAMILASCSSTPEKTPKTSAREQRPAAAAAKPADESRRFPQANLISSEVIDSQLLGKSFMPGGTVARYKKGKTEYRMFVAKAADAAGAAVVLGQWRGALANPQFVASFGGYFGRDGQSEVFVFTKGEWIAGVVGLSREQADAAARPLATRL